MPRDDEQLVQMTREEAKALQRTALTAEPEDLQEVALSRIVGQLKDAGGESIVYIYRQKERAPGDGRRGPGREMYLTEMDPIQFAQFGLRGIQTDFGPGDYRIKVHDANGRMIHNSLYSIDLPPNAEKSANLPAAAPSNSSGDIAQLAASIQQGFTQMAAIIAESLRATVPAQQSRKDMLDEMVMMKTVFAAPPQSGMLELVNAMRAFKEIMPRAEGAETTTADVFMGLVEKFAPLIVEQAKAAQAAPVQVPVIQPRPQPAALLRPAPAPIPTPQPAPVNPLTQNPTQPTEDQVNVLERAFWSAQLSTLVRMAEADREPATYAEVVLDQVPAMVDDEQVLAFLHKPNLMQELAQIDERVLNHVAWFEQLRRHMIQYLTDDGTEDDTDENSTGLPPGTLQ